MISVLELGYSIVDGELTVKYVIHIRKPKILPTIGRVTVKILNETNPEFNNLSYVFTIENSKMTRDTLVNRSHLIGMVPNCDKICLTVEDSYGYVSDHAFVVVNGPSVVVSAMFYCGKIKITATAAAAVATAAAAVTVDEFREQSSQRVNKLSIIANNLNNFILPWVLFYKDSSYVVTVKDVACLVLHTEGYTTAPSTYLSFNYTKPTKVQLIKFKVTHIQSDRIYFAFLNFAGGYQGIQATPDKRINGCKNILISSQWNDSDVQAAIIASSGRNLDEIFGGEGTGVKSMMDYNWKQGTDYYMAVHATLSTDGKTIEIVRYIRDCSSVEWTFISTTSSKHHGELLGKSVSSFLEAWTNESIQEGTFYQRANIYGGWAMNEQYQWLTSADLNNIEVAATNSILDPNNDLFSGGYDAAAGTFYYSHGYNKITGEISVPSSECRAGVLAYDSDDRENTGKYDRRYFLDKSKLRNAPTMDELVPSSKLAVVAVAAGSDTVRISVNTDIPYYKIEHKIGDTVTVHKDNKTKHTVVVTGAVDTILTTVYGIFGQITTVTSKIQAGSAVAKFSALRLIATLAVSNIYMTWADSVPMGVYRVRLSQGSKIIFDSDFTIMETSHVLQLVEIKSNTVIVTDNKHIYVKDGIAALQNSIKNRLVRASVIGKSVTGNLTPVVFTVVTVATY